MITIIELSIMGDGKTPSIIKFEKGLNVISGPSNTGKTKILQCIDAALGSRYWPLNKTGYTTIELKIESQGKYYKIVRKSEDKPIYILTDDGDCREYSKSLLDKNLTSFNEFMLKNIGLNNDIKIIKNDKNERISLTWRLLNIIFYQNYNRTTSEKSVLYGDNAPASSVTALNYLYNENIFEEYELEYTVNKYKNIREYLEKQLKIKQLKIIGLNINDVKNTITQMMDLTMIADSLELELTNLYSKSDEIGKNLTHINQKISEYTINIGSYQKLLKMYSEDLQRINFVVDGLINDSKLPSETTCPICNNKLTYDTNPQYFSSSIQEYNQISIKIDNLDKLIDELKNKVNYMKKKKNTIEDEKRDLFKKIDNAKQSYNSALKSMNNYKDMKERLNLYEIITKEIRQYESELEEYPLMKYKGFKLNSDSDKNLKEKLKSILSNSCEICFKDNNIEIKEWDIVLNGKAKKDQGSGYTGVLNTLLLAGITELLSTDGKHTLGLLMIDSPITNLKEIDNKTTISDNLFKYLSSVSKLSQIIVSENKDINFTDSTHVIKFTKKENEGRYGFLIDYRESDTCNFIKEM